VALVWGHQRFFARRQEHSRDEAASALEQASRITLSYFVSIQALNYDAAVLLIPVTLLVTYLLQASLPRVTRSIVTLVAVLLAISGTHDSENGKAISLACGAVGLFWISLLLAKTRARGVESHAA
jgi:hypothetical protein